MTVEPLIARMYRALKTRQCTCSFERNAAGVPIWYPSAGGASKRKLIQQCPRCALCAEYEAMQEGNVNE